jgi:SAM-dependent methyltransferase
VWKRSEWVEADALPRPHDDARYFDRYARRRRRRIAKSRRQLLDALEAAPPGPVLDVGCSLGYALEAAAGLGREAAGVDASPHAVEACRRLGLDVREGGIAQLPFAGSTFAVVLLKHVLEHTPCPREALAEQRRVLVPEGALFVAVPHGGYWKARWMPGRARFFRGHASREHFAYWTPATLERLLVECGFDVQSVHPRLWHRRAGLARRLADALAMPIVTPARALAGLMGLRKEFWMVATRREDGASPG